MGRPSKYSEDLAEQIAAALRVGLTRTDACAAAGITIDTLRNWEKRFSAFSALLTRAEAGRIAYAFTQAREAGKDDWRYWFAYLDRVAPQYRGKTGLELSGPDGGAIEIVGIELPLPVRLDDPEPEDGEGADPLLIPLPAGSNGRGVS